MPKRRQIRLPDQWSEHVKSGVLHAIALASVALSYARGRAATRRRLRAELDQAKTEIALLREELAIKDERWSRSYTRRRPHYQPVQRMRILELRAARGWTLEKTARRFLLDLNTLIGWHRRLDEDGEHQLVQTVAPVNRYPDFVRVIVRELKALFPAMGTERIAQMLGRAGLHLTATTVGRMLREPTEPRGPEPAVEIVRRRKIAARRPGDAWHMDLTAVPLRAGMWVPWRPLTLPPRWPFCWTIAVVVDQVSRAMVGFAVFKDPPTSRQVQQFLERAIGASGNTPRYLITDRGCQFACRSYRRWCKARGIRARFGKLGEIGSICIVERFIRSLKDECTRRLVLVAFSRNAFRRELSAYGTWYNEWRPHTHLGGKAPQEVLDGRPTTRRCFETRPRWRSARQLERAEKLQLVVGYIGGRKHLPTIELRRAA